MAGHIPDSSSAQWCTPDPTIECICQAFGGHPDLDPCSNPYSRVGAKTEWSLEIGIDGLLQTWDYEKIFVNPPYGKGWYKEIGGRREYIWPSDRKVMMEKVKAGSLTKDELKIWLSQYNPVSIGDWVKKCADSGEKECQVIGLIPAYPGTRAWQQHVWPRARAVFFPKGRLHFRLVYPQPDGSIIEKTGPAPMDVALPYWGSTGGLYNFVKAFSGLGHMQVLK